MKTHYDVLVDCILPHGDECCVGFFLDLEMQRKNDVGYSIPKREMYYCCRLITVFIKQVINPKYNPYSDYSSEIKEEVDEVMTIAKVFEEKGEIRGEIKGTI